MRHEKLVKNVQTTCVIIIIHSVGLQFFLLETLMSYQTCEECLRIQHISDMNPIQFHNVPITRELCIDCARDLFENKQFYCPDDFNWIILAESHPSRERKVFSSLTSLKSWFTVNVPEQKLQASWYFTLKKPNDCSETEQILWLKTGDYKGEEGGYQWDYIEKGDFIDWEDAIADEQKQWHIAPIYLEKIVSKIDNQMRQLEEQKRKYTDTLQNSFKDSKRLCVRKVQ